jgi:ABC-type sugar transport system ATPase subunit
VQQGAGILVISDDLDELLDLSDRIVVMIAGTMSGSFRKAELTRASLLATMSRLPGRA